MTSLRQDIEYLQERVQTHKNNIASDLLQIEKLEKLEKAEKAEKYRNMTKQDQMLYKLDQQINDIINCHHDHDNYILDGVTITDLQTIKLFVKSF